MQKVDINQVIREEQALMQEAAKEKGITIVDSLQSDLPPVKADRNQMKQVLVNLIKNAMEALGGDFYEPLFIKNLTGGKAPRNWIDQPSNWESFAAQGRLSRFFGDLP